MSVLGPEGWGVECNVDRSFVDENSPGRAYVELQSLNGDIDIFYMSHIQFIQASDGSYVTVHSCADYVYTDGDEVIWSNTALYDPGPGYEQIN